ncbi:MAG: hypothetical protein KME18_26650 [Phormidium tanganyikae FI6-MK23]|nr:hypothetical protein [Phormidium tanganyikae FI6-MK23]
MQRYSLAFPVGRSRSFWFSVQCQIEPLRVGVKDQERAYGAARTIDDEKKTPIAA